VEQTNSDKGKEISKKLKGTIEPRFSPLEEKNKGICDNALHNTVISFSFHLMLCS